MLSSKVLEVLNYLINSDEAVSIKKVSEEFKVSERSIRYEIEKANDYFENEKIFGVKLDKGVLEILDREKIKELIKKENNIYNVTSEEREIYIILKILLEREINQSELSDELDISKTTIKSHLKDIKLFLEKYNLKLEIIYRKGLGLIGNEENIRAALLKLINTIKRKNSIYLNKLIDDLVLNKIETSGIEKFINYCQKLMERIISDEAYKIITNYLKIVILMNQKGFYLDKIKNENFLLETKEYKCVFKSSPLLEANYEIELPYFEYLKITDYFLGSHTYNLNYSYYDNWVEMELIVKDMILAFNSKIKEDISRDKVLLEGLLNHIKPTIYRIKNGIELENSIYCEVIESYSKLFELVKEVVKTLEESMDIKFTNDEIAFLVIHFKAAMDRNIVKNKKIKVLLVCSSGYGTSKLLSQQIKEKYNVDIVDTIPKYMLEKTLEKKEVDLILSTVDINESIKVPILKLNSILTEEDSRKMLEYGIIKINKKVSMKDLLEVIGKNCKEIDENQLINGLKDLLDGILVDDISSKENTIFDYLTENKILINEKVNKWEEAIEKIGNVLLKSGDIEKSYIDNSVKTIKEYGGYMVLAPNVAFPHARTDGDVNKTAFGIITLEEPVILPSKEEISVFILFSSKDNKEHIDHFVNLVNVVNEDKFLKDLKKIKTSKEFIKYLKKELS